MNDLATRIIQAAIIGFLSAFAAAVVQLALFSTLFLVGGMGGPSWPSAPGRWILDFNGRVFDLEPNERLLKGLVYWGAIAFVAAFVWSLAKRRE